jgi:hypothetical protein
MEVKRMEGQGMINTNNSKQQKQRLNMLIRLVNKEVDDFAKIIQQARIFSNILIKLDAIGRTYDQKVRK